MPQNEQEWMELSREFEAMWNFQHCIGACDGKHIVFQCPKKVVVHSIITGERLALY